MRILLIVFIIFTPSLAMANMEEDKNAGTCAMYLTLAKKGGFANYSVSAEDALNLASNQRRALQYSEIYVNKIKDYQARKQSTDYLIHQGVKSCYEIGLPLK